MVEKRTDSGSSKKGKRTFKDITGGGRKSSEISIVLPFSLGYVRKVERASTVDVFGRVNLKTLNIPENGVCF